MHSRRAADVSRSVSVVVPCFNEASRLPATRMGYRRLVTMVDELIFVDDGSSDGTVAVLEEMIVADGLTGARVLCLGENQGKGAAVAAGMLVATSDLVVFMDADLATDLDDVPRLIDELAYHDVVIGSRAAAGHHVIDGRWYRRLMGQMFNALVRRSSGLDVADTQCGFKGFRRAVVQTVFTDLKMPRFSFDVEVLLRARVLGLSICEMPVTWTAVAGSHVRPVRDSWSMLRDIRRIERSGSLDVMAPLLAPQPG